MSGPAPSASASPHPRRPASLSDLLPGPDIARRVKVSHRTIQRWAASGLITAYKIGPRLVRYDVNEVTAIARPRGGAA